MTKPKKPIYWYQGLFLQPQHLQQLDAYHESLLMPIKKYNNSYFWGVCHASFNEALLKDLTCEITSGEFIFKDGTWVSIGYNAQIEPRSFKQLWEKRHDSFKVYVALKRAKYNQESVDNNLKQAATKLPNARFILNREENEVHDLYNHEHTAQIERLDYVLKLIWENEVELYPEYDIVALAKIEFNGQDAVLSHEFVPPVVNISNSPVLLKYLKNATEMLYARSVMLSNYKSLRKSLDGEYQPASLPFLLCLKSLCHYVPLLNHIMETPQASPWQVYGMLRQLLGELSMINDKIDVLGINSSGEALIPEYNHNNLGYCFKKVCVLIDEIIEELISSMESLINLIREGNYFRADIPVDLLRDTNKFYLCVRSKMNSEALIQILSDAIKIGCSENIPILIKRALPGVPLEPLREPLQGVLRRKDVTYFTLDSHHNTWQSIKEFANISIYLSDIAENVEISLLVLKGGELLV